MLKGLCVHACARAGACDGHYYCHIHHFWTGWIKYICYANGAFCELSSPREALWVWKGAKSPSNADFKNCQQTANPSHLARELPLLISGFDPALMPL